jgi:AbrB family transcriptional regulator (stage V sporulation protein T)
MSVIISDRDAVIACAGVSKKEYTDRHISEELDEVIDSRGLYTWHEGSDRIPVIADGSSHFVSCVMPIISEGDIVGCVAALCDVDGSDKARESVGIEIESKLVMTAAGFLGRQLES